MTESRTKTESLHAHARIYAHAIREEIVEKKRKLEFFEQANAMLAHLNGLAGQSKDLRLYPPSAFQLEIELSTLKFHLQGLEGLETELSRVLNRACNECKNRGTVTYAADGHDQTKSVTTPCPKCDGVCAKL